MKKEVIMAGICALLTAPSIENINYFKNPYASQQYVASTFKDTDDKYKKLQSYGSDSQSSDLNCVTLSENDIQNIVLFESEIKKKFEIKFNSWYDRYCSILSHGTDNCDELVDQLDNDQEDFFFDDFLMKFIVKAPVHLREIFIDDLLIGDIDIFNKSYKNMLVECSKLPFKTLAKKAYNILRLHSEEFDLL